MVAETRGHALMAPSAAHRWINCPGSLRACAEVPEETSTYAEEGSLAHEICAGLACKTFGLIMEGDNKPMTARKYSALLKKLRTHELYNPEMEEYAQGYVEFIESLPERELTFIEAAVTMEKYIPECYGTSDFIAVYGDTLHIIDFKYGRGVKVDAADNPQLMLYALGAYEFVKAFTYIETVKMTIYQPRIYNIDTASMRLTDLLSWAEAIKPAARDAYEGLKTFAPGDWCKFCKIKMTCRSYADRITLGMQAVQQQHPETNTIGINELYRYYKLSEELTGYAKALKAHIESLMLAGTPVPGLKLVEGRSKRVWTDEEQALFVLQQAGYETHYSEPYSLAQLERLIGKKRFSDMVGGLVIKSPGNPTIADADDARAEYKPYKDDFADIEPQAQNDETTTGGQTDEQSEPEQTESEQ